MDFRIYISGPITGVDDYMERFDKAEHHVLENARYVDDWQYYDIITVNPARILAEAATAFSYDQLMELCITMVNNCDANYMMDGWENSKGARKELERAEMLALEVLYETEPKGGE